MLIMREEDRIIAGQIRLPVWLWTALNAEAEAEGRTLSDAIRLRLNTDGLIKSAGTYTPPDSNTDFCDDFSEPACGGKNPANPGYCFAPR